MATSVRELGQTIVMVTHDPNAASYADRVVFLADGRIVDEMREARRPKVLDRMKSLGASRVFNATLKGLLAHKLRLALTALSIVLGVASSPAPTSSATRSTADVRRPLRRGQQGDRPPGPHGRDRPQEHRHGQRRGARPAAGGAARRRCAACPAWRRRGATSRGYAQIVDKKGKAVTTGGAPTIGVVWTTDSTRSAAVREGGPAAGRAERDGHGRDDRREARVRRRRPREVLHVGPPREYALVGIMQFGQPERPGRRHSRRLRPRRPGSRSSTRPARSTPINVQLAPGADGERGPAAARGSAARPGRGHHRPGGRRGGLGEHAASSSASSARCCWSSPA